MEDNHTNLADPILSHSSVSAIRSRKETPEGKRPSSPLPLGLLAMLGSAALFSIMALLVKCLKQFSTFELVFWRSLFMLLGTLSILAAEKKNPLGEPGTRGLLVARGVVGFGFMSAFYYAIKSMPLSDAVVITYTSPVITGVLAALILGEAWGVLDAVGSFLSLFGVILISKPSFIMRYVGVTAPSPPMNGTLAALAGALLSSGVYLLLRKAKDLCPIVSVNYFALVGVVLSPIFSLAQGEHFVWPEGLDWMLLSLLALLSIVGQALMNVGLARETAGKATAMNYVQVVFAYMYQRFLFHHAGDWFSVIGASLIASWGAIALAKETLLSQKRDQQGFLPVQACPQASSSETSEAPELPVLQLSQRGISPSAAQGSDKLLVA